MSSCYATSVSNSWPLKHFQYSNLSAPLNDNFYVVTITQPVEVVVLPSVRQSWRLSSEVLVPNMMQNMDIAYPSDETEKLLLSDFLL